MKLVSGKVGVRVSVIGGCLTVSGAGSCGTDTTLCVLLGTAVAVGRPRDGAG